MGMVIVKVYHITKRLPLRLRDPLINVLRRTGINFHPICGVGTLDTYITYVLWGDNNTFPPPSDIFQITIYLH